MVAILNERDLFVERKGSLEQFFGGLIFSEISPGCQTLTTPPPFQTDAQTTPREQKRLDGRDFERKGPFCGPKTLSGAIFGGLTFSEISPDSQTLTHNPTTLQTDYDR